MQWKLNGKLLCRIVKDCYAHKESNFVRSKLVLYYSFILCIWNYIKQVFTCCVVASNKYFEINLLKDFNIVIIELYI